VKHVLPWLAGWLALFWLWQLLTGEWNHQEWIAGASAATVAATVGEIGRTVGRLRPDSPAGAFARAGSALLQVFADFAILMWALPQRRSGRVHTRRRDLAGSRVWTTYVANFSPNAYVIDLDDEHVTLHDLVMHRRSESPA